MKRNNIKLLCYTEVFKLGVCKYCSIDNRNVCAYSLCVKQIEWGRPVIDLIVRDRHILFDSHM